jgi:hypothetical protein
LLLLLLLLLTLTLTLTLMLPVLLRVVSEVEAVDRRFTSAVE